METTKTYFPGPQVQAAAVWKSLVFGTEMMSELRGISKYITCDALPKSTILKNF